MHKAKTRLPALLAIPFALSFVADNAVSAQSASPSSVIREQAIGIRTRHSQLSTPLVVENRDEEKGDPGPYVLTGAALGALALGGAAALAADCNDDCMFLGQGIAIAAGIGAVVGGFVGWLAYEIVHHRPGPGP